MSGSPYFAAAFSVVVGEEGGYVNNPDDPGGETKYGISKRAYPDLEIANLTLDDAQAIYLRDYWGPVGAEGLAWALALCLFDCAVNQGVGAARAMYAASGPDAVGFMTRRAVRYAGSPNFTQFGLGWMRRLFTIFQAAQRSPLS